MTRKGRARPKKDNPLWAYPLAAVLVIMVGAFFYLAAISEPGTHPDGTPITRDDLYGSSGANLRADPDGTLPWDGAPRPADGTVVP